ncbi:unnamed protein product, partial [Didymodactylos carnosus]
QQQQLERVKRWLQLRNRDVDRRSAVEERRKKREEEAKLRIEELLRKEKQRTEHYQQRAISQVTLNLRTKPDVMSQSTDVLSSTRRAVSASRPRPTTNNLTDMTNRRILNHSPVPPSSGSPSQSSNATSSHHLNPIDEHTQNSNNIVPTSTVTNTTTNSSLTGSPRSTARSTNCYYYWLNLPHSNFMRLTYAASCRSRQSRSVERCPRACRAREEAMAAATITSNRSTTSTPNVEQRRAQSVNRSHLNDTIQRLSKPKPVKTPSNDLMSQSVNVGMPTSQSSHQLRTHTQQQPSTYASRNITRSVVISTQSNDHTSTQRSSPKQQNDLHASITTTSSGVGSLNGEISNDLSGSTRASSDVDQPPQRTLKPSRTSRTGASPNRSSKPPVSGTRLISKPKYTSTTSHRSIPSSLSSSSLSSSLIVHSNNTSIERLTSKPQTRKASLPKMDETHLKKKFVSETIKTSPNKIVQAEQNELFETPILDNNNHDISDTANIIETPIDAIIDNTEKDVKQDSILSVDDNIGQMNAVESSHQNSIEPIDINSISNIINNTQSSVPVQPVITKRGQQQLEEQEYQRKLAEKRREARERFEEAKRLEEERQRQLELEEQQREDEQRKLEKEQTKAEQERLQRAIGEREREENERRLKEEKEKQIKEELEKRQQEEYERLNRERLERVKREEDERNERRKRLDLIMKRTRQVSPKAKGIEESIQKANGHNESNEASLATIETSPIAPETTSSLSLSNKATIPHSFSETKFPSTTSTDNLDDLSNTNGTSTDTPKFKSPLIQNILNKTRGTRSNSTDNLANTPSTPTSTALMTTSMIVENSVVSSQTGDSSSDDEIGSRLPNGITKINSTSVNDLNLPSSNNYHLDMSSIKSSNNSHRSIETTTFNEQGLVQQ